MRPLTALFVLLALCAFMCPARAAGAPPGEGYSIEVQPAGRILWGRMRFSISPPERPGGRIVVTMQGDALNFDKVTHHAEGQMQIDAASLLPARASLVFTSPGDGDDDVRGTAAREGSHFVFKTADGDEMRWHMTLPEEPRDPLSAFLALRSLPLLDGDQLDLIVSFGPFYRTHVEVGRAELEIAGKKRRTIRLSGRFVPISRRGKRLGHKDVVGTMWLGDDEFREILRVDMNLGLFRGLTGDTSFMPQFQAPERPLSSHGELPGIRVTHGAGPKG